jgi:hypothetical protein
MARPCEMQRLAERGSKRVRRREDAFFFGSRRAFAFSQRTSVMVEGLAMEERLFA